MALEYGRMLLNIGFRAISSCVPGGALVHLTIEEFGPAFCKAAWDKLSPWSTAERQTALEQMGQVSVEEARKLADEAVRTTGIDPAVRAQVVEYLAAIPMAARRTLVQDSAAGRQSGLSLPASQLPRSQSELLRFLPLRPPRFSPGQMLAGHDYKLERLLGQGGFGEVWLATNPRRPRQPPRALKFCLDEPMRQSLERETDLLDRIEESRQHPGIVRLLGTALSADPPFLVYELVDGGDLTNWISSNAVSVPATSKPAGNGGASTSPPRDWVPPARVAALLVQVADALGFAHGLGLVHRDLKPSNVLIDRSGVVKLTDFGIGAVVAEQELARAQQQQSLTRASVLQGACTPMYADRAQRRGESVDARADVYAVGVMAYQLLLGDVTMELSPYFREELEEAQVPAELIAVVANCVALPERRYRDGAALLAGLEPVARKLAVTAGGSDIGHKRVESEPKPVKENVLPDPRPVPPVHEKKPVPPLPPPPSPGPSPGKPRGRKLTRAGVVIMALAVFGYLAERDNETLAQAQMVFAFGAALTVTGIARARLKNNTAVGVIAFAGAAAVMALVPPDDRSEWGRPAQFLDPPMPPAVPDKDRDDEELATPFPLPPEQGVLNLTGTWQGSPGLSYTIQQNGNQVYIQEFSAQFGATGGQGQGTLSGQMLDVQYRTSDGSAGRGLLQISADGRSITGTFTDGMTGAVTAAMLYR